MKLRIIMATLALFPVVQAATANAQEGKHAPTSQAALGQFMTPDSIAEFMAAQFEPSTLEEVRLLDAGAGQGALSRALAARWSALKQPGGRLVIDAFELDPAMIKVLRESFDRLNQLDRVSTTIIPGDFITNAVERIQRNERSYTHAILNPPYKKIGSDSPARRSLASVGIEAVNLYSGFVALALELLQSDGELVAIIPRSFCNGPYYKPFRRLILQRAAIVSIHLFAARDKAFAGDGVLQENVILRLRKGARQADVEISTSTDAGFADLIRYTTPFSQIVLAGDREQFIRIPVVEQGNKLASLKAYRSSLSEIGLSVSTGPVVDFRLKRHLRSMPDETDAPLLYPGHFAEGKLQWPRLGFKKANAIALNADTARWLYPHGYYVVVRRFSSKEERRRIVATLVDPKVLPKGPIGFENHLNVLHRSRGPLPEDTARGLSIYLNARVVDDWFRQFNGHTQVNATDLRTLPYPNIARLTELGRWSKANPDAGPDEIDKKVAGLQ
ncbi:MAG: Eco57I restriction-modification methylase domain-containing protein [Qipengyuania sp.]|nr:Eco57I restriction-modification methylase domain-containing protein [Qipengyuania sp.]